MWNLNSLSFLFWMPLLLLAWLCDPNVATTNTTTWVVSNEIFSDNLPQTVNVTCEPERKTTVIASGKTAHITARDGVLLTQHRLFACHFKYFGHVLSISTSGNVLTNTENFILFNDIGPYRRNNERENWVFSNQSVLVPFYGP